MEGEDSVMENERSVIPKHNLKINIWHDERGGVKSIATLKYYHDIYIYIYIYIDWERERERERLILIFLFLFGYLWI